MSWTLSPLFDRSATNSCYLASPKQHQQTQTVSLIGWWCRAAAPHCREGERGLINSDLLSPVWSPRTRFHPQEEEAPPFWWGPGLLSWMLDPCQATECPSLRPGLLSLKFSNSGYRILCLFLEPGPCPCGTVCLRSCLAPVWDKFPARRNLCTHCGHLLSTWGWAGWAGPQLHRFLCGNEPCGMRKPTSPNFRRRRGDFIGP